MIVTKIIVSIAIVCCLSSRVHADIVIYLKARFYSKSDKILLNEIAKIEADNEYVELLNTLYFDINDLRDGNIDRYEVKNKIEKSIKTTLLIFGSGTHIINQNKKQIAKEKNVEEKVFLKRGSLVKLRILNKGITIETYGTTLKSGYVGDEVPVKILRKRVVKGYIVNRSEVNIEL